MGLVPRPPPEERVQPPPPNGVDVIPPPLRVESPPSPLAPPSSSGSYEEPLYLVLPYTKQYMLAYVPILNYHYY